MQQVGPSPLRAGSQLLHNSGNRLRHQREERNVRVDPELPEGTNPSRRSRSFNSCSPDPNVRVGPELPEVADPSRSSRPLQFPQPGFQRVVVGGHRSLSRNRFVARGTRSPILATSLASEAIELRLGFRDRLILLHLDLGLLLLVACVTCRPCSCESHAHGVVDTLACRSFHTSRQGRRLS